VAKPDYQPGERKLVPYQHEAAPALRSVVDNFDRSQMPQSGAALVRAVPPLWKTKLTDQIEVWGSRNSEIPAVTLTITLPGGRRVESAQEAGLASLTAMLVRQGTQRLSGEQLSEELQRLGSSISIGAGNYNTFITVKLVDLSAELVI
jgi:zinc protease